MTSISAASVNTYQSPLQKLQDELLSEVNSGAVSSSDKDALSTALTDIDSAIQASRTSDQASGTRPSPDQLKRLIPLFFASAPSGSSGSGGSGGQPPPSSGGSGPSDASTLSRI